MPLFQKKENQTPEEKKLNLVTYGLFVVVVVAWAVSFGARFVLKLLAQWTFSAALLSSLGPSIITLVVAAAACVIVYLVYRKVILKL
jgi:uncharacterized membrane protein YvlD (DUF360 family)